MYKAIAATHKPVYFSTGAASQTEMTRARDWLGCNRGDVIAMVCDLVYPCDLEDAAPEGGLWEANQVTDRVGYSDHTTSLITGAVAVVAGATTLEKHVTLDPHGDTPDDRMALTVEQARQYLTQAIQARMLGNEPIGDPQMTARIGARRSAYAARDLPTSTVLRDGDIEWLRPAPLDRIPPTINLTGQQIVDAVKRGEAVTYENLVPGSPPAPYN